MIFLFVLHANFAPQFLQFYMLVDMSNLTSVVCHGLINKMPQSEKSKALSDNLLFGEDSRNIFLFLSL